MPWSTARSARSCTPSWPRRASSAWPTGSSAFATSPTASAPINKVDDIAGLKLRVIPNAINVDWVKALGANPTPLAFPEVYAALEQKAIDGQENPLSVIQANKFFEVQKYLTLTNHQYNPQSLIFSKKVWDTLSRGREEDPRRTPPSRPPSSSARSIARRRGRRSTTLKKAGMQVTEFSPAEQAKLREKVKPVIEKHGAGDRGPPWPNCRPNWPSCASDASALASGKALGRG